MPICLNSAELIFKLLGHLQIFWTIGNFYPNFMLKILVFVKKGNGDFFRIIILQRDHSIVGLSALASVRPRRDIWRSAHQIFLKLGTKLHLGETKKMFQADF